MNDEETPDYPILVPHSNYGDPDCCGIIMPMRNGEYVDLKRNPGTGAVELRCNECGVIIATLPVGESEAALLRMTMAEGVCSEICTHCGETNVLLGFSAVEAFTCRFCGAGVRVERPVQ